MVRPSAIFLPTAFGRFVARLTQRRALTTPVVIGATGGSGTRAVHRVLADAGVFMGRPEDLNGAGDAMPFEPFLDHYINSIIAETHGLDYALRDIPAGLRHDAARDLGAKVRRYLETRPRYALHWGWKNPRTMYVLPLIKAQFPDFRFIHVVRDGRDMAVSRNQNQYLKHYAAAFGEDTPGDDNAVASFRLWCKANAEVANYGRDALGPQYLRVRLEDFVARPEAEIARILAFLGLEPARAQGLAGLAGQPDTFGRWRQEMTPDMVGETDVIGGDVLRRFGYATGGVGR